MRTRVKVCGITRNEDARLAAELGADAIGFVFWPPSSRAIRPSDAAAIAHALPPFVARIGVFVNQPLDEIRAIAGEVGLTGVQLHGDEPMEVCVGVTGWCLKAVGVDAAFEPGSIAWWPPSVLPLLDASDPRRRGGTGTAIDWALAFAAARVRPVVLAGGLRPENIEAAIAAVRPYGVDVSSGVEREPGVKDPARLCAFFKGVARADAKKAS
ncbi:MAG: phosphoribosylanthranilate isomerase [Acidobacteria bacterium]|nr:phosphoribosylanthranilate isomerase [Acidobacteriota bacterium]